MAWIKQPSNPGEKDMWWNNATNQYTDVAPSDTEQFLGRFAALRPAGYESTGGFDSYIRGLQGITGTDLNNALNKAIETRGWGGDTQDAGLANVTRLADQERIKLLGESFDALGRDTGWKNLYNADTAAQQQGAVNARNERGQREYDASSGIDWGGIASGLGLVLGAGALGGAFGGSGLFGGANSFPVGGADWMGEIAAGAGNGGLGGVGNFVAPEAIGGTGGGSGGGMDWLDELVNSTQNDPIWNTSGNGNVLGSGPLDGPGVGDAWNGAMNNGGSDWATNGFNADGSINTSVMNPGSSGPSGFWDQAKSFLSQGKNVPTSLIKSMLGTDDATAASLSRLLGTGIGGLLDYKASSNQAAALKEIADRSWAAGQPYRDRANAAMTPGFDIKSIPGLSSAMDTATETYLRKLSATNGNPAGIGAAPSQTEAFVLGNVALPAWQNYFNANSNAGGLSNLSAQANSTATQAAGADAMGYGSLGTTINKMFNPQQDYQGQYLNILSKAYGLV